MKRRSKWLLLMLALFIMPSCGRAVKAAAEHIVVLDPGHGGEDSGCTYTWDGVTYYESQINLKIAKYCAKYLKAHAPDIRFYLTRKTDTFVGVEERNYIAEGYGADLLVSFHINDAGYASSASGSMVLCSMGTYRSYIAKKEAAFTKYVIKNLRSVGVPVFAGTEKGIYYRLSDNGSTYPNGAISDYYSIVCMSVEMGFPGVIIEHAFLSSYSDTMRFFSSSAKLKALGEADAKAIISYCRSKAAEPDYAKEKEDYFGWNVYRGKFYYRDENETILKNQWLVLKGKRYYLTESGARAIGFTMIGKKLYYFDEEGVAAKGKTVVDGKRYICTSKGAVRFKWYHTSADNFYYMYPKGTAKQGQVLRSGSYIIGKKVYTFDQNGICTNYHFAKKATDRQKQTLETVG